MSADWHKISKGDVQLKIYSGGIVGDEGDMIRKMRIGQLHAAGLTGVGLSRIFKGVGAIQIPLAMRNEKELIENVVAADWTLTEADRTEIDRIFEEEGIPTNVDVPQAVTLPPSTKWG